ncbi:head completion/stabilization protein [Shewanella sp.]|uniref:head completion/stabilization protein n=1 Tax=Shewanella sp. TaxID=50422 RepID=UPI003A970D28
MGFGFDGQTQAAIEVDSESQWPTLNTGDFRAHRRVPEFYEEAAIADSLTRSAMEVQQQLLGMLNDLDPEAAAPLTLATDEAGLQYVAFTTQQASVYKGAVYARSHADLLGYFSTVDQREAGNNKAQDVPQQNAMLAQSNRAIRTLLNLGRCGVHSL